MKQILAIAKFLFAITFLSAIVLNLFVDLDAVDNDWAFIIPVIMFSGVFLFYLVRTGIWNFKDEMYVMAPLAIAGLVLHFVIIVFLLAHIIESFMSDTNPIALFYSKVPILVGLLAIGIYDIYKFNQGRKYKKHLQTGVFTGNLTVTGNGPVGETIFNDLTNTDIPILVASKIEFKEYIKLMYLLTFRVGASIYMAIIGLVLTISSLVLLVTETDLVIDTAFVLRFLFGLFITFGIPLSVYVTSRKNYFSNERISEKIKYEFSLEEMKVTGESFNTVKKWAHTFKIEELKKWFLIYERKNVANLIPKSGMSEEEINNLRLLFMHINEPGIKLELKHTFE